MSTQESLHDWVTNLFGCEPHQLRAPDMEQLACYIRPEEMLELMRIAGDRWAACREHILRTAKPLAKKGP